MNVKMWNNQLTQENMAKLKQLGYWILNPEYGDLACGYEGMGRLADISLIEKEIGKFFNNYGTLEGKHILVTAGGTSEHIDPVRIITNESSGKMGIYIAEECAKYGAKVTLIRAHTTIEPNIQVQDIQVKTSKEMLDAIKNNIKSDIIIHAAAVSDFTLKKSAKKLDSKQDLKLELTKNTKILDDIKKLNKNVFLVGFKAEYKVTDKELLEKAFRKLKQSNADLIVANDVGRKNTGFGSDASEVFVIDKKKNTTYFELENKRIIAEKLVEHIIYCYSKERN